MSHPQLIQKSRDYVGRIRATSQVTFSIHVLLYGPGFVMDYKKMVVRLYKLLFFRDIRRTGWWVVFNLL